MRLLVMDIDSTLINEEAIDLLGDEAGIGDEIAEITARAMAGDLDFATALAHRVALLKGLPISVFDRVYQRVSFTSGALELVRGIHARGWKVGVVSGGFHEIADRLVRDAHIDFCLANTLEVRAGKLTGKTKGAIVTRELKLATMTRWAQELGCGLAGTIAIGDGANDIPMLQAAGIGIAFCAKPVVKAAAPFAIDERNLMRVFDIVDALPYRPCACS